jgi:hypothetical protein
VKIFIDLKQMAKKPNKNKTSNRGKIEEKPDRNPDGTFAEGREKTGGRQLGQRDFATDFEEAVKVIAKQTGQTISEVRTTLLVVAANEAKRGQFSFWNAIMERIYGKTPEEVNLNVKMTEEQKRKAKQAIREILGKK